MASLEKQIFILCMLKLIQMALVIAQNAFVQSVDWVCSLAINVQGFKCIHQASFLVDAIVFR